MRLYSELLEHDTPIYKLKKKGVRSLKDNELIVLILNSVKDGEDVRRVANKVISGTYSAAYEAYKEIGRRGGVLNDFKITEAAHVYEILKHDIATKSQEHFVVITVDGSSHVINKRTVFVGTLNQSVVHPREVFADAISDRATGIIVAHNHPSGTLSASRADIAVTQRLNEVAKLVGIELLDHVILTRDGFFSFADEGLL